MLTDLQIMVPSLAKKGRLSAVMKKKKKKKKKKKQKNLLLLILRAWYLVYGYKTVNKSVFQVIQYWSIVGGSVFFNGDIVLDRESEELIYGPHSLRIRWKRAATRGTKRLWKDGIVPFTFSDVCKYSSDKLKRYMIFTYLQF